MNLQMVSALRTLLAETVKVSNPDLADPESMLLKDLSNQDSIAHLHSSFKMLLGLQLSKEEFENKSIRELLEIVEKI